MECKKEYPQAKPQVINLSLVFPQHVNILSEDSYPVNPV